LEGAFENIVDDESNSDTGGGFSLPANIGYFKFYAQLGAHMKTAGKSLAVFSLSYTLAPHATYPTQQRQAVECVRYVLDKTGRDPANVYLGGDSAGGNLVCGVLSHISHPHPQINPLPLKGKLGGAVMIAPWTSMDTEFPPEIVIDSRGDIITEHVAGPWAGAYLGKAKRDYYTDLSAAPTEWFRDFRVKAVLVLAGGNEIMLPSLEDFITKFKVSSLVSLILSVVFLGNLMTLMAYRLVFPRWSSSWERGNAILPRSIICILGTRRKPSRANA
jgi:acetyl esterase/lipase